MARIARFGSSMTSWIRTMFGWSSLAVARASLRKRRCHFSFLLFEAGAAITLSATSRPSVVWRAR